MSSAPTNADTAGVIARPPFILLAHFAAGFALDWFCPAPFLPAPVQYALGAALILCAGAFAGSAIIRFLRAGTNVPTNRPTTALVTTGPYRFSRNPIYVGMLLLLAGVGVAVDSVWIVALAVPFALVLRFGVIAREERYLEAKFADAYRAYRARVRRWI